MFNLLHIREGDSCADEYKLREQLSCCSSAAVRSHSTVFDRISDGEFQAQGSARPAVVRAFCNFSGGESESRCVSLFRSYGTKQTALSFTLFGFCTDAHVGLEDLRIVDVHVRIKSDDSQGGCLRKKTCTCCLALCNFDHANLTQLSSVVQSFVFIGFSLFFLVLLKIPAGL